MNGRRYGRGGASMNRLPPSANSSPARTSISSTTRNPFTYVPFVELLSRSVQSPSMCIRTACSAETVTSAMTKSHAADRPINTRSRFGRTKRGVRGWRQAARTSFDQLDSQVTPARTRRRSSRGSGTSPRSLSSSARVRAAYTRSSRPENVSADKRWSKQARRKSPAARSLSAADGRSRSTG